MRNEEEGKRERHRGVKAFPAPREEKYLTIDGMSKEELKSLNEARGVKDKKRTIREETLNAGLKRMRMKKTRDDADAKGETDDG